MTPGLCHTHEDKYSNAPANFLHTQQVLRVSGQDGGGRYMRQLCQGELPPEAIAELVPVPTCAYQSLVLMLPAAQQAALRPHVILSTSMPHEKGYAHGATRCQNPSHLLQIEAIHFRREAPLPTLDVQHVCRLRRKQ